MFTLVYKSEANESLDTFSIEKLFKKSQARNKKIDVTGCMLHHQGRFVQLLEGEENVVKTLFKKIKKDKRHHNVRVLNMEESVLRIFGDWNMIYTKIDDSEVQDQMRKRQLFDSIFHSSNAVCTPGNSKLALWMQVNKLLKKDFSRVA